MQGRPVLTGVDRRARVIADFQRRYGSFGEVERRVFGLDKIEARESGAGDGKWTATGLAAVYNSLSLNLGGFQERIAPGAFDDVLSRNPDVFLLWDHDTRWTLAATRNKTLELSSVEDGLRFWGQVQPTSYAADLRVLMNSETVSDASFAFWVDEDDESWELVSVGDGEDYIVLRTIHRIAELYDVTICAQGAYPAANSQIARSYVIDQALRRVSATPEQKSWLTRINGLSSDGDGAPAETDLVVTPDESAAPETADDLGAALVAPADDPAGGVRKLAALKADARRKRLLLATTPQTND